MNHYEQRINLVLNYISANLTGDLSLTTLAGVASFSPFHFHRIFKTLTGETINDSVARLRLARAATLLQASPRMTVLDAALDCGFESASGFSRAFKRQFGVSPRAWDRQRPLKDSKNGKVWDAFPRYTDAMLDDAAASGEFTVQVRALPAQHLAYIRVQNPYQPPRILVAYDCLLTWYAARGGTAPTLIGMSQDDPDITPLELCRYDLCLPVPESWTGDDEVSTRVFPACQVASVRCVGDIYVVDRAWQFLFRHWLPRSRYQPDNLPAMEIYHRQPSELGWEVYDIDCAIPIVSL